MANHSDLKARYSARELAREWGWYTGAGEKRQPDHKKVIRTLAHMHIEQHRSGRKGLWFWTKDIERKAPRLFDWWKDKRRAEELVKIARGEAA